MNGLVEAPFGDGVQRFRLTIGGAEELEEKCDAGLVVIARRLASGEWKVRDVRETIRIGLVGGGMDATRALVLIERYASDNLDRLRMLALSILSPVLFGVPDDPPGKSDPVTGESPAVSGETGEQPSEATTGQGP